MGVYCDASSNEHGRPALLGLPALELLQVGISPAKAVFAGDEPYMGYKVTQEGHNH
jgi:hypothetical protein